MDSKNSSLLQKNDPKVSAKDVPPLFRKRYLVAFMVFVGMVVLNVLGAHFGIVVVEMTTAKNVTIADKVVTNEPEFKWTQFEKGALMSSHSVMFIFGFLGGMLGKRYGGTRVFGLAIGFNGILSILSPSIVKFSLVLFFIVRMLEGLLHLGAVVALQEAVWPWRRPFSPLLNTVYVLSWSLAPWVRSSYISWTLVPNPITIVAFGSFLQIFIKWSPSSEKFRMTDFAFSGVLVGVTIMFPICGVILEELSWKYVFYLTGAAAVLWYILWAVLIYEDPMYDKYMLEDEKYFIMENVEVLPVKVSYPWKKIFTSKAVWAYLNERFVEAWSISFTIECLPLYVRDSFDISISQIGFVSCVPHVSNFLGILAGGPLADFLRNRNILSSSKVYIFLISIGQMTCVVSFILMGLWKNFVGSMVCLCLMRFSYGFAESAYIVLPIDIAGEFASLVHGLGFSIFAVGAVLNPILMGVVVPTQSAAEWRHYFLLLSLFNLWGFIIFYFYGSGRPEPWTAAGQKSQSRRVCKT